MLELYTAASEKFSSNRTFQSRISTFAQKLGKQHEEKDDLKKAAEFYEKIPNPTDSMRLYIINLKAKAGDVDEALKQYKEMQKK